MITTLVGNYPKVAEKAYGTKLIGTISKWQRKELTDADLETTCREITSAVIAEQEQAGIDLVTDGQIRWEDLLTPVAESIEGFETRGALTRWFNNNVLYRRATLRRAPKRKGPALVESYRLAAKASRKPVKAVLPGPYTFATASEDLHFKNLRRFTLALADILNAEARDLAQAGAAFIQFDEPAMGFGKTNYKLATEALGVAAKGVKAKTAVSTYFGSLNGGLAALAKTPVDVIGVDLVSDPASLQNLVKSKVTKEIALGCVDARNTKLETVKDLHRIFAAVLKRVPADRLYVNPNCGLEFLPHPQAVAKMRRMVEAVRTYRAKT